MIVISFILQIIINNLINYNSYFIPIFPIITIIFFNKENISIFYLKSILIGLIFDIINNTYFFNFILFFIISIFIYRLSFIKNKYFYYLISFILIILIYNFVYYFIYYDFNIVNSFNYISHYIISNIIFLLFQILYKRIKNKFNHNIY